MRLDQYLVENGIYPTRNRAQEAIKQGSISVNEKMELKAARDVSPTDIVANESEGYV
jgi:predicted rRNA methylase YqxC with S4 and FtsJ domains